MGTQFDPEITALCKKYGWTRKEAGRRRRYCQNHDTDVWESELDSAKRVKKGFRKEKGVSYYCIKNGAWKKATQAEIEGYVK